MTQRYFFEGKNAHHAMCMGIDHGINFEVFVDGELQIIKPEQWRFQRLDLCERFRFYIHPESLGLLEPQVGDLIQDDIDREYQIVWCDHKGLGVDAGKGTMSPTGMKIIQRDGKAFMWPESEEA